MLKFFRHIRKLLIQENKFGKYLLYAIGEIILVVIGILIALQINNWNESKKTEQNITTSLRILKDEITSNNTSIQNVIDYHIMVKDTIYSMEMPSAAEEIEQKLSFWQGMQTPRLQNAAFQTSIQSGIGKDFEPNLLKTINGLYAYQDSYNEYTSQSNQIFFNADLTDFNSFKKIMRTVQLMMNDLYYKEKELLEIYESSVQQIDSIYPSIR